MARLSPRIFHNPHNDDNGPFDRFSGTFDRQGHKITDLTIDVPQNRSVGLFSYLEGRIENVTVVETNITGGREVGAIVGSNTDGDIRQSVVGMSRLLARFWTEES